MKNTLLFTAAIIMLFSFMGKAQDENRIRSIGMEQYREVIENAIPGDAPADAPPPPTILIYSENFDNNGAALPPGWTKGTTGTACQWNVDSSPAAPGFYSSPYSLNYNNGSTFDCGANSGWVRSPLINTSGTIMYVSFWFNVMNECGGGLCTWDQTYLIIRDISLNVLASYLIGGPNYWAQMNYSYSNPGEVEQVYLEFYFDTYDFIGNSFYGPFIDNLELREEPVIPISNWALVIGIALIATFVIIRYRR
jgi:hypothetical protein